MSNIEDLKDIRRSKPFYDGLDGEAKTVGVILFDWIKEGQIRDSRGINSPPLLGNAFHDKEDNAVYAFLENTSWDKMVKIEYNILTKKIKILYLVSTGKKFKTTKSFFSDVNNLQNNLNQSFDFFMEDKNIIKEAAKEKEYSHMDVDDAIEKARKALALMNTAIKQLTKGTNPQLNTKLNSIYNFVLEISPFQTYLKKHNASLEQDKISKRQQIKNEVAGLQEEENKDIKVSGKADDKTIDIAVKTADKNDREVMFETTTKKALMEKLFPSSNVITEAPAMSKADLQEKITRFNKQNNTNFYLEGSYSNLDLWVKDSEGKNHRLTSGSVKDCYDVWVKNNGKGKWKLEESITKKSLMEMVNEEEDSKYNEIKFTIPQWAAHIIANDDWDNVNEDEEEQYKAFQQQLIDKYGTAYLSVGDERGFCHGNDINGLGGTCYEGTLLVPKSQNLEESEFFDLQGL